MKSRRLTIFCVAMITLVGTPRAWQEVGKLLATAQHKAQVKFWSMVLPGDRESANAETIAAAQPSEASSAEVASNCPLEGGESRENQVASNSQANRRTIPASLQAKAKAQRAPERAPASHGVLTAKALKAVRENSSVERLLHSASMPENQLLGIAESRPPSSPRPGAVVALPAPPASNGDSFRYVLIPNVSPAVSALVDKESIVQLKLMRKSFEDNKVIRQKGRFPVSKSAFPLSKSAAAFPSS